VSFGGLILTQNGINIQGKVQGGKTLQFTRIGIGSGDLTGPMTNVSAMINEIKSMPIVKFNVATGGKVTLGFVLSNQEIDSGFWWKEIGVYAKDPDTQQELLYAYGNAQSAAEYIPAGAGSTDVIEKNVDVVLVVGTGGTITATIDKSHVYETIEDAEQKIADAVAIVQNNLSAHTSRTDNPHAVTKAQVGLGNADNTSDVNKPVSTAQNAAITAAVNALKALTQNMKITQDDGQGKSVSETDFNNIVSPGFYTITTTTMVNAPSENAGMVIVIKGVSNLSQLFFSDSGRAYYRFRQGSSSWNSWKNISSMDDLTAHTSRTDNPHSVTKSQVGLGNADNTSDVNKPVSTAQAASDAAAKQAAIDWAKGFGLGGIAKRVADNSDVNNLISNGWYDINNGINAPFSSSISQWCKILVICAGDSNYITQLGFTMTPEGGIFNGMKIRQRTAGGWSTWREIAGKDNVDALRAITQNVKITADNGTYKYLYTDDAAFVTGFKAMPTGLHFVGVQDAGISGVSGGANAIVSISQSGSWGYAFFYDVTHNEGDLYVRVLNGGTVSPSWVKISDSATDILTKLKTVDGSGSALDADTVDGKHVSGINGWDDGLVKNSTDGVTEIGRYLDFHHTSSGSGDYSVRLQTDSEDVLSVQGGEFKVGTNKVWHQGNDGSGSGLDSDLLDGYHASNFLQAINTSLTYYVDLQNGNDANDGLSLASAFKTFPRLSSEIIKYYWVFTDVYVKIYGSAGSYDSIGNTQIVFQGTGWLHIGYGSTAFDLQGRLAIVNSRNVLLDYLQISYNPTKFSDGNAVEALKVDNCERVVLNLGKLDGYGQGGYGLNAFCSKVLVASTEIDNCTTAIYSDHGSDVITQVNSGSNNQYALTANAAVIRKYGSQPSGNTQEYAFAGGQIL
jgi:hypothetical protein